MKIARRFVFITCFVIGIMAMSYFNFEVQGLLNLKSPALLANELYRLALYLHIAGGIVAILLVPFQLFRFRKRHKVLGRIYAMAILVGGIFGFIVAFRAYGGWISQTGLMALAIAWLWTTWKGIDTIRHKDVAGHRRWMLLSFSLTYAAFVFRMVLLGTPIFGFEFLPVYHVACWSWLLNLAIAKYYITKYPNLSKRFSRGAKSSRPNFNLTTINNACSQ